MLRNMLIAIIRIETISFVLLVSARFFNVATEKSVETSTIRIINGLMFSGTARTVIVLPHVPQLYSTPPTFLDVCVAIRIKNKMGEKGHQFISGFLNKITLPKDIKMIVDVDPLDIL